MKCESCGSNQTIKTGQTYHFSESGLDNVYLENLKVEVCGKCKAVSPYLPRVKQLMETLGRAVALQTAPLTGTEVSFLRKHAGCSTREWAAFVRASVTTQTRWEAGTQAIEPQADLLHRLVYFCRLAEREKHPLPERLIEQLTALKDEQGSPPIIVINTDNLSGYIYRWNETVAQRRRAA